MIDLLREFEALLQRLAPESAAALRPGLAPDAIEALLAEVPQPVPDDVRDLYAWHDGTESTWGSIRAELFAGGPMLPLAEALNYRQAINEMADSGDQGWLPIFSDEVNTFHAVVCGQRGGEVVSGAFVDLPDFTVEYASLHHLMDSVVRRWRAGAYHATVNGGVAED